MSTDRATKILVRREHLERLAAMAVADLKRLRNDLGIEAVLDFAAGWWCNEMKHQPEYMNTDGNRNAFERIFMGMLR